MAFVKLIHFVEFCNFLLGISHGNCFGMREMCDAVMFYFAAERALWSWSESFSTLREIFPPVNWGAQSSKTNSKVSLFPWNLPGWLPFPVLGCEQHCLLSPEAGVEVARLGVVGGPVVAVVVAVVVGGVGLIVLPLLGGCHCHQQAEKEFGHGFRFGEHQHCSWCWQLVGWTKTGSSG